LKEKLIQIYKKYYTRYNPCAEIDQYGNSIDSHDFSSGITEDPLYKKILNKIANREIKICYQGGRVKIYDGKVTNIIQENQCYIYKKPTISHTFYPLKDILKDPLFPNNVISDKLRGTDLWFEMATAITKSCLKNNWYSQFVELRLADTYSSLYYISNVSNLINMCNRERIIFTFDFLNRKIHIPYKEDCLSFYLLCLECIEEKKTIPTDLLLEKFPLILEETYLKALNGVKVKDIILHICKKDGEVFKKDTDKENSLFGFTGGPCYKLLKKLCDKGCIEDEYLAYCLT
jgi:hypothetical protein